MSTENLRRHAASLVVIVMLTLGCGGSGEDGTESAESSASTPAPATQTSPSAAEPELITIEPADGPTNTVTVSALGGVRFEYPADLAYLQFDDVVLIHPPGMDPNDQNVALHLATQLPSGNPVSDLDTFFEAIEKTHAVEPTGTSISLDGIQLDGFEISGDFDTSLFANTRHPAPVSGSGGPQRFSRLFVAETPSGILTIGLGGAAAENADAMMPVLGTVLDGFEFVGPGLDPPLPPGESLEPVDGGPPPPPIEAREDATVPPLGAPFSPIAPGRYELLSFGFPVSVDVGEGWFVAPNFPGLVVLTSQGSIGPGDRAIVFVNSIAELTPIAAGPIRAGEPVAVSDIDALIESPPEGVSISRVERFDAPGPDGAFTRVVAFDVIVDSGSDCSPTDPCEFAFFTTYGERVTIRPAQTTRVWWFPDHPYGPAAAIATAPPGSSDWLAEAEALMATLEVSR